MFDRAQVLRIQDVGAVLVLFDRHQLARPGLFLQQPDARALHGTRPPAQCGAGITGCGLRPDHAGIVGVGGVQLVVPAA